MIENIMEHIARQTGKDPLEVRMNNLPADSEMTKLLPDFAKSIGERLKLSAIALLKTFPPQIITTVSGTSTASMEPIVGSSEDSASFRSSIISVTSAQASRSSRSITATGQFPSRLDRSRWAKD